jgi:hypothetical protein
MLATSCSFGCWPNKWYACAPNTSTELRRHGQELVTVIQLGVPQRIHRIVSRAVMVLVCC